MRKLVDTARQVTEVWALQVNQADLKYVNPAARAAAGGARAALGADYELKLRSEAGPMPGKLAKRKHQISSLYHHAKIMVGLLYHICGMVVVGSESLTCCSWQENYGSLNT